MSQISSYFDSVAFLWDSWQPPAYASQMDALVRSLPLKAGNKVLDVACGTGILTSALASVVRCPVLGIDLSPKMIQKAKENHPHDPLVSFEVQDFYTFKGVGYDAVVLFDAYPHFLDIEALGKAASRVLKKGGVWCILHDVGRKELASFPAHHDPRLSRDIASPQEEAVYYQDDFVLLEAKEDSNSYRLILQKK